MKLNSNFISLPATLEYDAIKVNFGATAQIGAVVFHCLAIAFDPQGAIVSAMFSNNIIATFLPPRLKWLLFNSYLPDNVFLIKLTSSPCLEKKK